MDRNEKIVLYSRNNLYWWLWLHHRRSQSKKKAQQNCQQYWKLEINWKMTFKHKKTLKRSSKETEMLQPIKWAGFGWIIQKSTMVKNVLLYHCSTWNLKIQNEKELDRYHKNHLKRALRIKWSKRTRCKNLYKLTLKKSLSMEISEWVSLFPIIKKCW